ncbi:rubrerythrin family protein [Mobilitalea sibirica]|uniref:Rubrerythrin family protein n=1 Tax=Mobilitalea sibirica TaxID=1462919 RepID=A0A8J7KZI7_9FIRM|nr:rubrerythrin family protein [Mobilitalea sibirica]MBH1940278.1 rubrerythrin family protein [Mobilitalea sibirica]
MDFQQSRTYSNLMTAYEDELMASARYEIFGEISRNEGYIEIGNVFETTARNDRQHARTWLRVMNDGVLPTTAEALEESAQAETLAGNEMYREFARVAREEGYNEIAALFNGVANIDLNHGLRFRELYEEVIRGDVFCKDRATLWICMQCGNIMSGECAPIICPVCGFPQGYYRLYSRNIDL